MGLVVSREIRVFTVTIPAGTTQAAPFTQSLAIPPRTVSRLQITVPPGPSGLMGFAVQNSGVTVIPYLSDSYIVTAGEFIDWELDGYIDSGSWQAVGYNLDVIAHSFYVRMFCDIPGKTANSSATIIDNSDLNNGDTTPDGGV